MTPDDVEYKVITKGYPGYKIIEYPELSVGNVVAVGPAQTVRITSRNHNYLFGVGLLDNGNRLYTFEKIEG